MGRRKERRLAAMGAGRRVKLDLFAEPTGDLGGSSTLDEVGGEGDSKTNAKFPSSPSSSGQLTQNPLMLLEQYSDEEMDEDSNKVHNHAEDPSVGMDEESKVAAVKEAGDGDISNGKESSEKVEQLLMDNNAASQCPLMKAEKESITGLDPDNIQKQTNLKVEATYPPAPDEHHPVEDVRSGWKMVLHEESSQYYYWNVVTGETSWEVPDVLAQENVEISAEKVTRDGEGKTDAVTGTYKLTVPLDMEDDDTTAREHGIHSKINGDQEENMDGSNEGLKSDSIEYKEQIRNANEDSGTSTESQSGTDLSSQLIEHCKSLLERLDTIKSLNCDQESLDLKLKCKLEIEIRLADIKALASHKSSLLPFWLRSDAQLKQVEAALDTVINRVHSAYGSGINATPELREGDGHVTDIDSSRESVPFATGESHAGDTSVKSTCEYHNCGAATTEHVPSVLYPNAYPVNNVSEKSEITGSEKEIDSSPKHVYHYSVEDADMDVDMEVEDTSLLKSPGGDASGAQCHGTIVLGNVQNNFTDQEPKLPAVFTVAPPDEEWIPPPPPDNEPIPPPPPDDEPFPPPPPEEPPETSYPPSHLGPAQAFPYPEQYTLSYPGSGLEYYVQANHDVSGATLYTHSEGSQAAPSHVPHYYEAASNVYGVAPMIVNPVEPTSYYGLQNGTLSYVPLMNSAAESSGTQSEPVPEVTASGSLDSCPEPGSNLLLKNNIDADKPGHGTVKSVPELREAQTSIRALATSTASDNGSAPSTSGTTSVSAAAAAAAAKAQSKVSRTKKRTVAVVSTLRSNKKVSSLVDKWKAAKEELQEEEEEPEDPLEILERKRRREIEQWRAQQIASGEAKDNANFQPLGGDWRERVKRRRAEKMKESGQSSPDVATDGNQQTDLSELSKGLPSGWKAYWDESSKQVYYGNVLTSETTWIKPTE